jgi:hypothetical protein
MDERMYDFEDLEDYLQGRMVEPDRVAFESALEQDRVLQRRVEALRREKEVLYYLQRAILKEKLVVWRAQHLSAVSLPHKLAGRRRLVLGVFAAILVITLLLIFIWHYHRSVTQKLSPSVPTLETPVFIPDTPAQYPPGAGVPNKLPPPSAPQAGARPENWPRLGEQAYKVLVKKDVLMGDVTERDMADSVLMLISRGLLDDAFLLAYQMDTTQSAAQLYLAHIAQLKRDYTGAAYWYGTLKKNPDNVRFRLDAQLNEIACYIYLMPGSRSVLLHLMKPVMEKPEDYLLSGERRATFEAVWVKIHTLE